MAHKKTKKNPKGAGRPPGSKNKPKSDNFGPKRGPGRPPKLSSAIRRIRELDESEFRRLRGRPKGSSKENAVRQLKELNSRQRQILDKL